MHSHLHTSLDRAGTIFYVFVYNLNEERKIYKQFAVTNTDAIAPSATRKKSAERVINRTTAKITHSDIKSVEI